MHELAPFVQSVATRHDCVIPSASATLLTNVKRMLPLVPTVVVRGYGPEAPALERTASADLDASGSGS